MNVWINVCVCVPVSKRGREGERERNGIGKEEGKMRR